MPSLSSVNLSSFFFFLIFFFIYLIFFCVVHNFWPNQKPRSKMSNLRSCVLWHKSSCLTKCDPLKWFQRDGEASTMSASNQPLFHHICDLMSACCRGKAWWPRHGNESKKHLFPHLCLSVRRPVQLLKLLFVLSGMSAATHWICIEGCLCEF